MEKDRREYREKQKLERQQLLTYRREKPEVVASIEERLEAPRRARVQWIKSDTYRDAVQQTGGVIYVHIHPGHVDRPYYIGKASDFSQRYRRGYAHWIDGSLKSGSQLFLGVVAWEAGNGSIDEVEQTLIRQWNPVYNDKGKLPLPNPPEILHSGNVPRFNLTGEST